MGLISDSTGILNRLAELDERAFRAINSGLASPTMDLLMSFVSSRQLWLAVSVLILVVALWKKNYAFSKHFLFAALTVGLMDLFAARILKPNIARLRPCKAQELVRIVDGCAGSFSFPSNHATNAMAVAVFFLLTTRYRSAGVYIVFLALLIGFSRVYLGVHYPADVLVGFVVGSVGACLTSWLFRRFKPRPSL